MKKRMRLSLSISCGILAMLLSACSNKASSSIAIIHGVEKDFENQPADLEKEDVKEDSILSFEEKTIVIEGLEKEYQIWFLADSHIALQDGKEDAQTAEYAQQRADEFLVKSIAPSEQIFSEFIDRANEEMPDAVLFGGDIIDFPSEANLQFLHTQLDRLQTPYLYAMGNHDWTFPWEYMTEAGMQKYKPLFAAYRCENFDSQTENGQELLLVNNDSYAIAELEELVLFAVDNSANQMPQEAVEGLAKVRKLNKPILLLQHVPFSTEALIARAKEDWSNPVTLGMQIHGGIAVNEASTIFWENTHTKNSLIKGVLAGHVHFSYEENLSETTTQWITDAAFHGKVLKLKVTGENKRV